MFVPPAHINARSEDLFFSYVGVETPTESYKTPETGLEHHCISAYQLVDFFNLAATPHHISWSIHFCCMERGVGGKKGGTSENVGRFSENIGLFSWNVEIFSETLIFAAWEGRGRQTGWDFRQCRALFTEYRALFIKCRAITTKCKATDKDATARL